MRKNLSYLLAVFVILGMILTACAQAPPEAPTEAPPEMATEAPPEAATDAPPEMATEAPPEDMEEPADKKVLNWSFSQSVACLDPAFQTGGTDSMLLDNIYNKLVKHNNYSLETVDPDLAESWEVSDDGLVYTFHLRQGVQWQKGYGEVTAQDVVWTWERAMDPDVGARGASVLAPVTSVEALDDYTVQVTLDSVNAPFLINIAHAPVTDIVNQQAVEDGGEDYCLNPVGTGPYQIVEADTSGTAILEAFDDHFNGRPAIDEVVFHFIPDETVAVLALKSGEIDYMIVREPANIVSLKDDPSVQLIADEQFAASVYALWLNNTREPFDDIRVRRALIHAIDRETLVREATEGFLTQVAHSVIPPSLLGHTEDVMHYDYDPELAIQLLQEAGYDGGDITISAQAMQTAFNPIMLTIVQEYWADVGVNLEIEYMERAALREKQGNGDYDITISNPTRAETDLLLEFFRCENFPPGPNFALYEGPCDLINEQARELDQDKRVEMIVQIQQQIAEDAPIVPLWYPVEVTAASNRVTGLVPNLGSWTPFFYLFDLEQ
jgi:ABC-type transport system substrate-binding protein